MSTQKWSDDDLDAFFRKPSEEADPAYEPEAWQDLQTRLNNRDRTLLQKMLLRWGLPVLLLLLSTGSIIWYTRLPASDSQSLTVGKTDPAESIKSVRLPRHSHSVTNAPVALNSDHHATAYPTKMGMAPPLKLNYSARPDEPKTRSSAPIPVESETSTRRVIGPIPDRLTKITRPVVRSIPRNVGSINPTAISRQRRNPATRVATAETKRVLHPGIEIKNTFVTGNRPGHENDIARQDASLGGLGRQGSVGSGLVATPEPGDALKPSPTTGADYYVPASLRAVPKQDDQVPINRFVWPALQLLTTKGIEWPASPDIATEPILPETTPSSAIPRTARTRFYGLSVQLVLSPDLSTVGLKNFDRPGSNLGVSVQYQLSERFSVQTGALWSTKVYTAQPSEYSSPTYMHVVPESITGRCTMFDVPVNLRYDVLLRPGGENRGPRRWFVSGGVTSYFIDHEAYNFNFKNPNDPGITAKGWDNRVAGRKGGSFGLSNLNVSVGYEQSISRRLSWQIEPFMKVPLQPVGYFKVKLLSTGAFLSLRYRL